MSRRKRARRRAAKQKSSLGQKLLGFAAGCLVLLAILALCGWLWVRSYLRTDDFREQLAVSVGQTFGGDLEIAPLQWEGLQMHSESVETRTNRSPLSARAENIDSECYRCVLWM